MLSRRSRNNLSRENRDKLPGKLQSRGNAVTFVSFSPWKELRSKRRKDSRGGAQQCRVHPGLPRTAAGTHSSGMSDSSFGDNIQQLPQHSHTRGVCRGDFPGNTGHGNSSGWDKWEKSVSKPEYSSRRAAVSASSATEHRDTAQGAAQELGEHSRICAPMGEAPKNHLG